MVYSWVIIKRNTQGFVIWVSVKRCFKFKPPSRESTFIIVPIPGVLHSSTSHYSYQTHCQCSVSLGATSLQSHSFDYFRINSLMYLANYEACHICFGLQGSTNFTKTYEPPLNSRRPKGVIKQVPRWEPTILEFEPQRYLAPRVRCMWSDTQACMSEEGEGGMQYYTEKNQVPLDKL